jgi:hypothetical protein
MTEKAPAPVLFKQQEVKPNNGKGKKERKERKAPVEVPLSHFQASYLFDALKKVLEPPAEGKFDHKDGFAVPINKKKRAREETDLSFKAGDAGVPSAAKKAKLAFETLAKAPAEGAGAGAGSGSGSKFCS